MSKLLVIDDDADLQYSLGRIFDSSNLEMTTVSSGEEGLRLIPVLQPELVMMDLRLTGMSGSETLRRIRQADPKQLVILMTAYGTTQTAIEAMKLGAYDYLLKPFDPLRLRTMVTRAMKAARDMRQALPSQSRTGIEEPDLGIVGRTESMQGVFKLIGQLARSDATVLITGESGTGKEMVARAIHEHGERSRQPFLAVNCAAIPEQLLESELFGHQRGAFTGATFQRIGKFEQCNHGTLFLDEIGDMTPATQTKLLRVLQSATFERVGGNESVEVDVRIIAATNKPIEQAVAAKQFREELFYRLNVVRVAMPPLRERREDIPLLVSHFLNRLAREQKRPPKTLTPGVLEALRRYDWPGNVRELENVIRRALVLSKGEVILVSDLPGEIADLDSVPQNCTPTRLTAERDRTPDITTVARQFFRWAKSEAGAGIIAAVQRELVAQALLETEGNQVRAAKLLGMTRPTLRNRMRKFNLPGNSVPCVCAAGS
jgi:two-component system nitrogen regulation response regulator GlnG